MTDASSPRHTRISHLNLGRLGAIRGDLNPATICHCMLLADEQGYALVDTGFGVAEMGNPAVLGQATIDGFGVELDATLTAVHQLAARGISPGDVRHIVLTHLDVDHAGGLADFPEATVHVGAEELASLQSGNPRYVARQFAHDPRWRSYASLGEEQFGLAARAVGLGFASRVWLVPLFGHSRGHCGVLIEQEGAWVLHAGDAYYRRVELHTEPNPLERVVVRMAEDNVARAASLAQLQRLARGAADALTICCAHDLLEFPG